MYEYFHHLCAQMNLLKFKFIIQRQIKMVLLLKVKSENVRSFA